jgi:molecular chaperone GrpE
MAKEQKQKAEEATAAQGQEPEMDEEELTEVLAEGPEEVGAEEAVDELALLRQDLEEARAKEAEYLDGWQRARAELANARKRFERERAQAYANAKADVMARLLPMVDDFERAFEIVPDDLSDLDWVEGVRLIQRKSQALLEQEGVVPIEAVEQEFDPRFHQALTHEPAEDVPEGHVIAEVQKGYRMGDRVLRPSTVRVSSGPFREPEPEAEPTEEAEAPVIEQS